MQAIMTPVEEVLLPWLDAHPAPWRVAVATQPEDGRSFLDYTAGHCVLAVDRYVDAVECGAFARSDGKGHLIFVKRAVAEVTVVESNILVMRYLNLSTPAPGFLRDAYIVVTPDY